MLLSSGQSVFAYDYEGYGRSEGNTNMYVVRDDALCAYRYLTDVLHYKSKDIILFGESLGTAITALIADSVPCAGIVYQSPLYSVRRRAGEILPLLKCYPKCFWPEDGFDNSGWVTKAHPPFLIIAGVKDPVIPIAHADDLFSIAIEPKKYVRIEGAGHTGNPAFMNAPQYKKAIQEFVDSLPP